MILKDQVLEINKGASQYPRSWFVDERVISDGSVLLMSKVDPLFLLLPVLNKDKSRFHNMAQLLSSHPGLKQVWSAVEKKVDLAKVCEIKEDKGQQYIQLDDSKVMQWLVAKVSIRVVEMDAL